MHTWDLSKIYKNNDKIQSDLKSLKENIEKMKKIEDNIRENLLEIFQLYEKSQRIATRLISYSMMKRDEDSRIAESQKRVLEINYIVSEARTVFSCIEPFLLQLNNEEIENLLNNEDFKNYHKTIEKITRFKAHTLSQKEEALISALSPMAQTPQNDYYMLTTADLNFGKIKGTDEELTDANYIVYLQNKDREIRENAFKLMMNTYSSYRNTIGATLYANIRDLVKMAEIRSYDSARQMELFQDDVPVKVYDNLLDTVNEYLKYLHQYYDIRQRALDLDETHMWDVYMPLTKSTKEYTYEEAQGIIIEALEPMGEEYQDLIRTAFRDRWIDVYPRPGKHSGAYSYGNYDSDPYILMNYTNDLDSVFTLIHELGHSIHSYYSRKNNGFLESNYTIFVAEVASTFNENLLLDYLMKNAKNDDEKIEILNHHINSFKSTVFRQAMFAEFEKITHDLVEKGNALSAEDFSQIHLDLNKKYFGKNVVSDPEIANEWMRIPHFYRNFYVYKYATGFSCATILSQAVLNGGAEEKERYINFLKDGGNHYPLEQLRMAGCDLMKEDTLPKAFNVFKNKVEELDRLIQ